MLIRHSVFYFLSRALPGVINLIALSVYTHLLTPDDYGRYALAIYSVGLANTLLYWWLRSGLLRFAPRYAENQAVFLATVLRGFFFAGGVSFLVAIASFFIVSDAQLRTYIAFSVVLLWAVAWYELNLELIRSRLQPIYFGALSLMRAIFALLVGGALAWAGFSVWGLLIGAFVSALLPGLWESSKSWRHVNSKNIDYALLRRFFSYGWPLVGVFGMEYVVSSSDRFMLAWLIGTAATGTYSAAYDLTNQSLTLVMSIVYVAGYPLVVKTLEEEGELAARQLLSRYLGVFLAIGLPAVILMMVLAPGVSGSFLGGPFHDEAAGLIPWVALATLFAALKAYYFDIAFQLSRRTSRQLLVIAFPAVLNVLLNLWWIPHLGVMGATYATLAAYLCAVILSWQLGKREFMMPLLGRDVISVILSAGVMVMVAILWLDGYDQAGIFNWFFLAVVLFGVYGSMVFMLNVCDLRTWVVERMRTLLNWSERQ